MTPRDRGIMAMVGILAAVGAFWFLGLSPKRDDAKKLEAEVTKAEQRVSDARSKVVTADQAKAGYQRDYAAIARLGKAVPTITDEPSLVYQLETAARKAKVDFRAVRVEGGTEAAPGTADPAAAGASGIKPKPFTLTFEGSYNDLRRFLKSVGGFNRLEGKTVSVRGRLLTLDGLTLSPGRAGFPQVKAEVTAKAYVSDNLALPTGQAGGGATSTPATPGATSTPAAPGAAPTTPAAPGAAPTAPAGQTAQATP